jgi:O-antigen/teichoic acid export membrane protein
MMLRMSPPFFLSLARRIDGSPIASRLARGIFWSLTGTVLVRGLSVLASIIGSRLLGQEGFGALGIIQGTVLTMSVTLCYPLSFAATKYLAEFRATDPEKAGRILSITEFLTFTIAFFATLIFAVSASWISENILAAPSLIGPLRSGSILLFVSCINCAQTGALAGFEAFRVMAKVNFITGIMIFAGTVSGVLFGGLHETIWGITAGTAGGCALTYLALRREAGKARVLSNWVGCLREASLIARFSLPTMLSSLLFSPITWACSAILVRSPNGYAEMGVFNASNQWFAFIMFLPGIVSQVILPILSNSVGRKDEVESRRALLLALRADLAVVVPSVTLLSAVSPWIMSLYGESFAASWPVLLVSLMAAGMLAIQAPASQLLNAQGKVWSIFCLNLFWAVLFVCLTLILIPWGASGLASARLIAYTIQCLIIFILVWS